jgi:CBS domain-containing protein
MALFGSTARAPLAVMLMVAEMTDSLAMLAPAMLAIGLATLIVGDRSIYSSQLRNRSESPAHRFRFALPLMNAIPAGDAARSPRVVLDPNQTVKAARTRLEATGVPGAPVVDKRGSLRGSVDLVALVAADQAAKVGDLALDRTFVSADDSLDDVLGILADGHQSWVPVVANDRLTGILSTRDVVAAYRGALAANVRQVSSVGSTGTLLEAEIGPTSALAGKPVSETAWPRESVLVSVMRGEKVIVPRGNVVLEAGDHLTVFTAPAAREALHTLLASRIATEAEAS